MFDGKCLWNVLIFVYIFSSESFSSSVSICLTINLGREYGQEQIVITCSLLPEDHPLDFILVLLQLVLNSLLHIACTYEKLFHLNAGLFGYVYLAHKLHMKINYLRSSDTLPKIFYCIYFQKHSEQY